MSAKDTWYRPIPKLSEKQLKSFESKCKPQENGCILWTGNVNQKYGQLSVCIGGKKMNLRAHRIAYTLRHGAIPDGMTLDHTCRTPLCVNPDHLRPMGAVENTKLGGNSLKTHCPKGHEYSGENLKKNTGDSRRCVVCTTETKRKYEAKRTAARKAAREA